MKTKKIYMHICMYELYECVRVSQHLYIKKKSMYMRKGDKDLSGPYDLPDLIV